jgi:hypothetical protein
MAVKPCLDKDCPAKDCLDRECLVMVYLTRAMARCQEVQVGMAVDKRLKLVDGIKANLLRTTATDTKTTRVSRLRFIERQIQGQFATLQQTHKGRRLIGGWAGLECELNVTLIDWIEKDCLAIIDLDRPEFVSQQSIVTVSASSTAQCFLNVTHNDLLPPIPQFE